MRPGVRPYPGAVVRYLDEKFVWTVEFGSHRDHPVVAAHEGVHDGVADGLCNRELDVTAIRPAGLRVLAHPPASLGDAPWVAVRP